MSNQTMCFLIFILFSHFISDFYLQSTWMAENKSKCFIALFSHVLVYIIGLLCGVALFNLFFPLIFDLKQLAIFIVFNFCGHFVTDAITSRVNKYFWKKQDYRSFFIGIGIDQFIHSATLIYSIQTILLQF